MTAIPHLTKGPTLSSYLIQDPENTQANRQRCSSGTFAVFILTTRVCFHNRPHHKQKKNLQN